jgi:hypothetical protein
MRVWLCIAFGLGIVYAQALAPERPRDVAGSPMTNLCASYARWKVLAGPKIAEPDPAPNLTRRCIEGP